MGKMTVYHGSYMTVKEPAIIKGRNTKDFGIGFYCTIIREQAERWAKRYDMPVVNVYTVRMNTRLKILEFKEMTEEWLDFIIDCRHGISHDYDIVIGAMAKYSVPSHWDIGKVYKRLILGISKEKNIGIVDALIAAYNSYVSEKIDDYNSSFFYDAPQNILNAFLYGKIE